MVDLFLMKMDMMAKVEGGEYLAFIANLRDNYKDAPRCSFTIKQFVKSPSGNQWVDVQYKFNKY